MGIQERKQRQRENLKSRILETARDIATKDGWDAVSMRRIAESIEYTAPVIYSHFKDKDDLLKELVGEGFRLLDEAAEKAREGEATAEGRLRAIAKAYWKFAFENPEYYQVMFNLQGVLCKSAKGSESEAQTNPFAATIEEVLRAKGRDAGEAPELLHSFFSILHGFVSFAMAQKFHWTKKESEAHLEKTVERLIRSI